MRYKEKSLGEGVLDTWHFFVDELAPVFIVFSLLMAALVGCVFGLAWLLT